MPDRGDQAAVLLEVLVGCVLSDHPDPQKRQVEPQHTVAQRDQTVFEYGLGNRQIKDPSPFLGGEASL